MSGICPCTMGNSIAGALFNLQKAKQQNPDTPEQTAEATVLSRRVDTCYSLTKTNSSWAYLVTFRLENSEEPELKVSEADYKKLKEDTALTLTWQGDTLVSFVMELE